MRPVVWMVVAFAVGTQAQTTVTLCENYSYTDTITFTEYATYYVTVGAGEGNRSTTMSSRTSFTSVTLPPASSTSNRNTNGGVGGSRSTTTIASSTNNVPGNGTSIIIPGDDEPVTPSTPIPTSSATITVTATTSTLPSVSSTDPEATSSSFYIVFNVPTITGTPRRLAKRAVEYLAFDDEGQSILVTSEADAATFSLDEESNLRSGSQYIAFDENADPLRFKLQDDKPETPIKISVDANGNVSVPGVEGFCLLGGDLVVLSGTAEVSGECRSVEVQLIRAGDATTSTTSVPSVTPSISFGGTTAVTVITTSSTDTITGSTVSMPTSSGTMNATSSSNSSTTSAAETTTSADTRTTSVVITTSIESTTVAEPTTTSETTSTSSYATSTTSTTNEPEVTNKAYIDTVIRHHNRHRANHTADPLVWNAELAATAKKISDGCVYAHDTATDCPPDENGNPQACYGQNIGAGYLPVQMGSIITDGFYNGEVNYYTYYGGEPDTSTLHAWGHFSQIVWKDTESVGCYTTDCTASGLGNISPSSGIRPFFTVCNYGPPGNWLDEFDLNVVEPVNFATIGADYECPSSENCEDGA